MNKTKTNKMTKVEAQRILYNSGNRNVSFLCNFCSTWSSRPAKRLVKLAQLYLSGHEIKAADFRMDLLVVDGKAVSWADFDAMVVAHD